MDKPTIPKGTRDFGPTQMAKRQFIFNTIRKVFEKYGFQPLETPAMENLSTLTGKYGEEGDQLLFKILDSGDYYEKMLDRLLSPNRIIPISKFLSETLKEMCRILNRELSEHEIRYEIDKVNKKVLEHYHSFINYHSAYLEGNEKELLSGFFEGYSVQIAFSLIELFSQANIYKENFDEKIDFHFNQFLNTRFQGVIIPKVEDFFRFKLSSKFTSKGITKDISEKGLKYDLTVPFARYVVMNRHELAFPFKRYQIQPVWRADRPQKGRYREFYQCDADVVGTDSLVCEAEIILMIKEVFKGLGIVDYTIKINHRGILSQLAKLANAKENESSLFVAIDKLDKIGEEKVKEELVSRGFEEKGIRSVFEILNFKGTTQQKIDLLKSKLTDQKSINDLSEVLSLLESFGNSDQHVEFDIALARGLSYYTGCIFEVKINNVTIGSVSGGGRYDNLTGVFGLPDVSGVGFSFGVDRLYDAMEELKIFPAETLISSKVLVCYLDEECQKYALKTAYALREKGIAAEVYPDLSKLKKQLDYADRKKIPFTIVIGSEEMKSGKLAFKNMSNGDQQTLTLSEIISKF